LDCKPVNILRANFSFRALAIPAGDHKVEMRYESKAFSTGLMISIFTLAFALALMVNYKKLFKKELI
jgi:uncharacterized membrane protein YfhO